MYKYNRLSNFNMPVSNNYEFTLLEGNTRFTLATQYYIHIIHKKEIKQVYGYIPSHKFYETIRDIACFI